MLDDAARRERERGRESEWESNVSCECANGRCNNRHRKPAIRMDTLPTPSDGRTDGRTDYRSLHRDLGDLIPSSPFRCSGPSDKPAPSVLPIPRENVLPSFLRQCHRHVPEPSSSARVASMSSLTRPPLQQFVPWRPQSPRVSKEEERLSLKAQVRRPTRERL